MTLSMTRRQWLGMSLGTAAAAASGRFLIAEGADPGGPEFQSLAGPLDRFVEQYMRDMHAPGLTLALADAGGVRRIATYGFSSLQRETRVLPGNLFQIGSISKSMTANCLLQLQDEGRLDLHKPVDHYLPWLRIEMPFGPITAHHLLTHTSGLPENASLFPSDPAFRHRPGYAPGTRFHYSNLGYRILGNLIRTLDGGSLAESFRRRIFEPLGMTQSEPIISLDTLDREAESYSATFFDRPLPRAGRLSPAPGLIYTEAAGCVLSTPRDMGRYAQMLARGGRGPKGRLVSEAAFAQIVTGHTRAAVFGPTASYGYGLAVDVQDGHRVVRHTGGMRSFASSLVVDLDAGLGAFASINAMQGYRPTAVTNFAVQSMRAIREMQPQPPLPGPAPAARVERPEAFAGTWLDAKGDRWEITAQGNALFLLHQGQSVPMEPALEGDLGFLILHPDLARFPLVFTRADPQDPDSPVEEAGWGEQWFTRRPGAGPRTFDHPPEWETFRGHYRSQEGADGFRICLRKGVLWMDGQDPLEPLGDGRFRVRDEEGSPEWISFHDVVNGMAMRVKLSGDDLWRVMAP